jgi:putative ABC transport system permease protein
MFLLRLAFKNSLRNKRRVGLSLVSVVAGVAVYILGQGFITGMKENILRAQIDKVSGHVALRPADYPTDGLSSPLDGLFVLKDADAAWLSQESVAWTRRLVFAPEAIVGPDLVRVKGIAFDATTDAAIFPRDEWQIDGALPGEGLLIGIGAAELLNVGVGDWITLRTRTVNGAINALQLPVEGVLRSGSPVLDTATVLLPWKVAEPLLMQGDRSSHVHVRLADRDLAEGFAVELARRVGPEVSAVTWRSETAEIIRLQDLRQTILNALSWALLLMAATGIANTVLMAAYERVREIGTLRAMGMTRAGVVQLFVIEGGLLGVVGGALGAALGGAAVWRGAEQGIDLAAMVQGNREAMSAIPFSTMLYLNFDPSVVLIGFSFGLVVAVAASVYPAIAASSMSPADAVRA